MFLGDNYFGNKSQDSLILTSRAVLMENLLSGCSKFYNVKIVGDQMPVIHFTHNQSKLECRLFLRNGLVVENTELIK